MKLAKRIGQALIICLLAAFIATGCASYRSAIDSGHGVSAGLLLEIKQPQNFQWPDPLLQSTFQKYWTLRKNGNGTASWTVEAPYIQDMVIKGRYLKYVGVQRNDWQQIAVLDDHQVSDHLFYIDFNMITDVGGGEHKEVYYRDFWIHHEGKWVHVIKDMFLTEI